MMKTKAFAVYILCLSIFCLGCATHKDLTKKKARARQDLGLSYIRQGDLKLGTQHLIEAAKLDPENADIHHELAEAYKGIGEYVKALVHYKKALALRPEFPEAQNNMGHLYVLRGEWDLAISCFQRALKHVTYLTPHYAFNNLGLAYYHKGEYQKATASYQQALRLLPSYSLCLTNLGLAYEAMDRWDEAMDAYEKAISYDPEYAAAHFGLGRLLLKLNRNNEAGDELRKTVEIEPAGSLAEQAKRLLKTLVGP